MNSCLLALLLALPADSALRAAAGKADITPNLDKEKIYLAGYGAWGRKPKGIRDPLYARAVVLGDGKTKVALVAVDSIGIYREDVLDIRRMLGWGSDGYLFLAATHDHAAPDTMGLWGPMIGVSGVDKRYHKRLKFAVVDLVKDLAGRLEPVELVAGRKFVDPKGLCRDSRDPVVIDDELNALQWRGKDGKPVGTLVRWSCHPEVLGEDNKFITADFPGDMCARIEEKTGGACLFFPGAIGGLMNPDVDRSRGVEGEFEEKVRVGHRLADEALAALGPGADRFASADIRYSTLTVRLPVENSRYLAFLRALSFGHVMYDAAGNVLPKWKTYWYPLRHAVLFPLPEALRPWVETELSLIHMGPVKILGVPGELFPELALGGYGGEKKFSWPLVGADNPNPPKLSEAPKGPYLREKLGAKHGLIIGLANDEVGYLMPEYDFQAAPTRTMTPEPAGTHYEETNSIGKRAAGIILDGFDLLLGRKPEKS